jgi:hypothetical protein
VVAKMAWSPWPGLGWTGPSARPESAKPLYLGGTMNVSGRL